MIFNKVGNPMKKIALITNKILGQSLASVIKGKPDLELEPYLMPNFGQALLDAQVWQVDIAVVDLVHNFAKGTEALSIFCEELRRTLPQCHILLLVSQDDMRTHDIAIETLKSKVADDYVFYDTSLNYLLAKLVAF